MWAASAVGTVVPCDPPAADGAILQLGALQWPVWSSYRGRCSMRNPGGHLIATSFLRSSTSARVVGVTELRLRARDLAQTRAVREARAMRAGTGSIGQHKRPGRAGAGR